MAAEAASSGDVQLQAWEYFLRAFGAMGWQSQLILAVFLLALAIIMFPSFVKRIRATALAWMGVSEASEQDDEKEADSPRQLPHENSVSEIVVSLSTEWGQQMGSLRDIQERTLEELKKVSETGERRNESAERFQNRMYEMMGQIGLSNNEHVEAIRDDTRATRELATAIQDQGHVIGTSVMATQERQAQFEQKMAPCESCHTLHTQALAAVQTAPPKSKPRQPRKKPATEGVST